MTGLEFLSLGALKELFTFTALRQWKKRRDEDANLRQWKIRGRIPVADVYLQRKGGYAVGRFEQVRQKMLVNSVRWFVETHTFEHLLGYFLNKNSASKQAKPKTGKAGVKRHWPAIRIVS